jgi:hypothetical protein
MIETVGLVRRKILGYWLSLKHLWLLWLPGKHPQLGHMIYTEIYRNPFWIGLIAASHWTFFDAR